MKKLTTPVGTAAPAVFLTVAVNVTGTPKTTCPEGEIARTVDVAAGETVSETAFEVLRASTPEPL